LSLILTEERRLRISENMMLRSIFGLLRGGVMGAGENCTIKKHSYQTERDGRAM
jgi:hypothetical protein